MIPKPMPNPPRRAKAKPAVKAAGLLRCALTPDQGKAIERAVGDAFPTTRAWWVAVGEAAAEYIVQRDARAMFAMTPQQRARVVQPYMESISAAVHALRAEDDRAEADLDMHAWACAGMSWRTLCESALPALERLERVVGAALADLRVPRSKGGRPRNEARDLLVSRVRELVKASRMRGAKRSTDEITRGIVKAIAGSAPSNPRERSRGKTHRGRS